MSVADTIKKSVLEGFSSDISTINIMAVLLVALALGIFIYVVYRLKTKSQFYSPDFNGVLLVLPLITAGIVLAIQSNIVISLGMVGALSIVRFRNAVKNAMDLVFLFWSISVGIIVGANIFKLAVVLSILLAVVILLVDYLPVKKAPFLLVANYENIENTAEFEEVLLKNTSVRSIKSRNMHGDKIDFIVELKTKDANKLIEAVNNTAGIVNVSLLQHDGSSRF